MSLPSGWAEATLGAIAETRLGKMLDAAKNKGVERPYLRNVNVRWGGFDLSDLQTMRVTQEEFDALRVRDGDIFACEGGEPGRCAVWREGPREVVYQKALHRIRPEGDIDPDFLAKRIGVAVRGGEIAHLLTGTTIKHLPQVGLQKIRLQIPPALEQRRIVAKLDALTARLDRVRGQAERGLVLGAALRDAALSYAREMTAGASEAEIEDLAQTTFDGPFGSNLKSSDYVPAGVRVVRLENIGHLRFLGDKHSFITEEKFASLTRHTLAGGDLLFSSFVDQKVRVCLFPEGESLTINKADCFAVRLDPTKCDRRFVAYMLAAPKTYENLKGKVHGATRPRIGLRDLRALRLPIPSLAEQASLADRLDDAFARADRFEAEAKKALALIDRLEAAILAKAFRGELVAQDPNDEPASVLLERIRVRRAAEPKVKRGRRPKLAS